MPPIQLGLCCSNTVLRAQKPPVYASRTMTMKMIAAQGMDVVRAKVRSNLQDVLTMMDWNHAHHIHVFRLSSDLFIHATNPAVPDYGYEFALDLLHQIGDPSHTNTLSPGATAPITPEIGLTAKVFTPVHAYTLFNR